MFDRGNPNRQLKTSHINHPLGLKLEFNLDGNTARTEFVLNENHQGPPGAVHNGVVACLMDEGMGWIARHVAGVNSVTAKMDIEFHKPARVGERLLMTAYLTKSSRRLLEEGVRIEREDGTLIAEGSCLQYVIESSDDVK